MCFLHFSCPWTKEHSRYYGNGKKRVLLLNFTFCRATKGNVYEHEEVCVQDTRKVEQLRKN